jgi:hypothetical protein
MIMFVGYGLVGYLYDGERLPYSRICSEVLTASTMALQERNPPTIPVLNSRQ